MSLAILTASPAFWPFVWLLLRLRLQIMARDFLRAKTRPQVRDDRPGIGDRWGSSGLLSSAAGGCWAFCNSPELARDYRRSGCSCLQRSRS